jgi:Family of unknown function (DUF5681)
MSVPYSVGYGKPPKKNQFKKGESGNPRGRAIKRFMKGPKEPLSFEKALVAKLKSRTTVTTKNGRPKKITMLEALAAAIVARAVQGDPAAMRYLFAQLHDAFVEDGDGIYTVRYNEAQMKAQMQAIRSFIKDVGEYEIPESEQDGGSSSLS